MTSSSKRKKASFDPNLSTLRLDTADTPVHFIYTREHFERCTPQLLNAVLIGIDTETRPRRSKFQPVFGCSLIQLAVRGADEEEAIFLIDLQNLHPSTYSDVFTRIFLSPNIIKLGQQLHSDLRELNVNFQHFKCFHSMNAVVEINALSRQLTGMQQLMGLAKLTQVYLKRNLNKKQQMSNWAHRPLTQEQIEYAALDALVLIRLYDVLVSDIERQKKQEFNPTAFSRTLVATDEKLEICSRCSSRYHTREELEFHQFIDLWCRGLNVADELAANGKDFKCQVCQTCYNSRDAFADHWNASPACNGLPYCIICQRGFANDSMYESHRPNCKTYDSCKVGNQWKCSVCGNYFASVEAMVTHMDLVGCRSRKKPSSKKRKRRNTPIQQNRVKKKQMNSI